MLRIKQSIQFKTIIQNSKMPSNFNCNEALTISDLVFLIRDWLTNRKFYVQLSDECSSLLDSDLGTIKGSVLGPILHALFVSPLFDICNLTNFADDNYCWSWNTDLQALVVDIVQFILQKKHNQSQRA